MVFLRSFHIISIVYSLTVLILKVFVLLFLLLFFVFVFFQLVFIHGALCPCGLSYLWFIELVCYGPLMKVPSSSVCFCLLPDMPVEASLWFESFVIFHPDLGCYFCFSLFGLL